MQYGVRNLFHFGRASPMMQHKDNRTGHLWEFHFQFNSNGKLSFEIDSIVHFSYVISCAPNKCSIGWAKQTKIDILMLRTIPYSSLTFSEWFIFIWERFSFGWIRLSFFSSSFVLSFVRITMKYIVCHYNKCR